MTHSVQKPKRRRPNTVFPSHRAAHLFRPEVAPGRGTVAKLSAGAPSATACGDWLALRTWEDDGGETQRSMTGGW